MSRPHPNEENIFYPDSPVAKTTIFAKSVKKHLRLSVSYVRRGGKLIHLHFKWKGKIPGYPGIEAKNKVKYILQ